MAVMLSPMHAGYLLVFLLSAAFVSESGGSWLQDKVRNFTGWVKDNCSSSVDAPSGTSVSCRFNGRKRDLDNHTKATLDKACRLIEGDRYGWEEGISMDLVTDIFQEVDADGDGILDGAEYTTFMESMDVFKYCLSK